MKLSKKNKHFFMTSVNSVAYSYNFHVPLVWPRMLEKRRFDLNIMSLCQTYLSAICRLLNDCSFYAKSWIILELGCSLSVQPRPQSWIGLIFGTKVQPRLEDSGRKYYVFRRYISKAVACWTRWCLPGDERCALKMNWLLFIALRHLWLS